MERIAVIDIGTNTALLLIADLDPSTGRIEPVLNDQSIIRLGKGVDESLIINRVAVERLRICLEQYRQTISAYRVSRIIATATSAMRDARNRYEVINDIKAATGIEIELLGGGDEAELTYRGAIAGFANLPARLIVLDIGGGSTEIVMGTPTEVLDKVSLNIGAVRLTERFFKHPVPTAEEFNAAKLFLTTEFAHQLSRFVSARENVFAVAGTATTIAQLAQGLRVYSSSNIHGYSLRYESVRSLLEVLRLSTPEQIAEIGVGQGRADVITAGTLILHQFMRLFGTKQLTVSERGLRFGVALRELDARRQLVAGQSAAR